jgi:hypothetical protein
VYGANKITVCCESALTGGFLCGPVASWDTSFLGVAAVWGDYGIQIVKFMWN